jgi:hypothetical protein
MSLSSLTGLSAPSISKLTEPPPSTTHFVGAVTLVAAGPWALSALGEAHERVDLLQFV